MRTEDQSDVIAFLGDPATHGGHDVERIETHGSIVFLAGQHAWKLKRAVRYDYMDFSTVERRRLMCEGELRLNRRIAPTLYHAVVPVTREDDGHLAISGHGEVVDWLVAMQRFEQEALFDRLASRNALDPGLMAPLGRAVARLHAQATPRPDRGGADNMAWVIDGNASGLREFAADIVAEADICRWTDAARARLAVDTPRLERRRHDGRVRYCHGDLHLRNVVVLPEGPTLFDGIEFNEALSCIDVAYDLAFLLMDLWRRDLRSHANVVWNAWLAEVDDLDAVPLLPLFLSCRAAVRAKTSATAAAMQPDGPGRVDLRALTHGYLALAQRLLAPQPARVVAIGGLSGTGKSTLARRLAPHVGAVPGAVLVRTDEVRKRLFGVHPQTHLGADAYTPAISNVVYATVAQRAGVVVAGGHGVVVDGVCARQEERDAIARIAVDGEVPFTGLWLEAPEAVRLARAEGRGPDASDADATVVRRQGGLATGAITWHRLDATRTPAQLLADALTRL